MEKDTERIAGWIESVVKGPDEIADVFIERRAALLVDWADGAITNACARQEEGLSARLAGPGRENLVFVSDSGEKGAREAIRSLQRALGRPPLPVKPGRAGTTLETRLSAEADRWNRRLSALLSRIAPRHRLRWSLSEVDRLIIPAKSACVSSRRRLLSIQGTFTAASRRGDEVRSFAFHAPDSETTGNELRAALVRAAEPRETPGPCGEGSMDVVLAGGCATVFFHEILSHPLEAGVSSPLSGLEQARLAVSELDVRDDPTRLDLFGGYEHDDEGVVPRPVKLLDAGRLSGFLTDRAHAPRGVSNGHARRAGPSDTPLPRSSNILIATGHATRDEMARRLASGLWIDDLEGGSVELASGNFRLRFPRARRVRRGRLADECGPGILAGEILPALKSIESGLGQDLYVYRALGFCARAGQVVPVGGASPDVLVRGLAVRSLL